MGPFKTQFIALLNLKVTLWDPEKALLWPEGFLPARFQESAANHEAAGGYPKPTKPKPPGISPSMTGWDNTSGYNSSPVVF